MPKKKNEEGTKTVFDQVRDKTGDFLQDVGKIIGDNLEHLSSKIGERPPATNLKDAAKNGLYDGVQKGICILIAGLSYTGAKWGSSKVGGPVNTNNGKVARL